MTQFNDKYRMMGIVPYNISPIQQGIQFGHAVVDYMTEHNGEIDLDIWAVQCKTFIILNGGTTNNSAELPGTMNQHLETMNEIGCNYATFHEPDLGNQLTAMVFIVPEQVYNKKDFPNFWDWNEAKNSREFNDPQIQSMLIKFKYGDATLGDFSEEQLEIYNKWLELIGGQVNVDLRKFTSQFRLA